MDPALPVLMPKSRGDVFSGWLQLEVGMIKAWKNRFCELRGAELRYFAKEGDAEPKGLLVVAAATDVPDGGGRDHRIDLRGSAGGRRLLRVAAPGAAAKAAWLERFGALSPLSPTQSAHRGAAAQCHGVRAASPTPTRPRRDRN